MKTLVVVVASVIGVVGSVVLLCGPAGADCSGPAIRYEAGSVVRGSTVPVEGRWWGDACWDDGRPPPGQGLLGRPITSIEIVVVQEPVEIIVARGTADEDYAFAVDVVVPAELEPGPARLIARWDGGRAAAMTGESLVVTDDPPIAGTEATSFGPGATPPEPIGPADGDATPRPAPDPGEATGTAPASKPEAALGQQAASADNRDDRQWSPVAGLAVAVAVGLMVRRRARRRSR